MTFRGASLSRISPVTHSLTLSLRQSVNPSVTLLFFQGQFKAYSRFFQDSFKALSWFFQSSFKVLSKFFQSFFKVLSKSFQSFFKVLSKFVHSFSQSSYKAKMQNMKQIQKLKKCKICKKCKKKLQNITKMYDPTYCRFGHVYLNILKSDIVLFCLL